MSAPETPYFSFVDTDTFIVSKAAIPIYGDKLRSESIFVEPVCFSVLRRMYDAGRLCDMNDERARNSMLTTVQAYEKREEENPYHPSILFNSFVPLVETTDLGRWKQVSMVHSKFPTDNTCGLTLSFMPAPYRHSVLKALDYVDVDAVACRASLINYFLQNTNCADFTRKDKKRFNEFIRDKSSIFEQVAYELSESWIPVNQNRETRVMTVDDVKTMFTAALNGMSMRTYLDKLKEGKQCVRKWGQSTFETIDTLPVRMHPLDGSLNPSLNPQMQNTYEHWKKMKAFVYTANQIVEKIADANEHNINKWLDVDELDDRKAQHHLHLTGDQITMENLKRKRRICLVDKILTTMEHFAVFGLFREAMQDESTTYFRPHEMIWGWDGAAVRLLNPDLKDAFLRRINKLAKGSCLTFKYKEFDRADPIYVEELKRKIQLLESTETIVTVYKQVENRAKTSHNLHTYRKKLLEKKGLLSLTLEEEEKIDVPIDEHIPLSAINRYIRSKEVITDHFNRYVKRVDSAFVEFTYLDHEHTLLEPRQHKRQDLVVKFENLYYYELQEHEIEDSDEHHGNKRRKTEGGRKTKVKGYKKLPFINEWLKDEHVHTYGQLDKFPPGAQSVKPNSLNTWVSYRFANRILNEEDYMPGAIEKWNELCSLICGHHAGLIKKVQQSIASKIQQPSFRMPYLIFFLGPQGSGKGNFVKTVQKLFGDHQACLLSNPDRDVFGDKSDIMARYDILICDDVSPKTFNNVDTNGKVQNGQQNASITADYVTVRPLYCNPYNIRCYAMMMACADDINCMPANAPRRFLPVIPSAERVGDFDYWDDYNNNWVKEDWYAQTIYSYLSKLSMEGFQGNSNLVEGNPANSKLIPKTLDPPMRFMMWLHQLTCNVVPNPSFIATTEANDPNRNPYLWTLSSTDNDGNECFEPGKTIVYKVDDLGYQRCHIPMTSQKFLGDYVDVFFVCSGNGPNQRQVFIRAEDVATLVREYQEQDNTQLNKSVNNSGGLCNHFGNSSQFKEHVKSVARNTKSTRFGEAARKTGMLINMKVFQEKYDESFKDDNEENTVIVDSTNETN